MANPTKAITATLRTMIAMAATSMVEKRFAMRHFWRQSSDGVDLDHAVLAPALSRGGAGAQSVTIFLARAAPLRFVSRQACTSGQVDDAIEPCGEC